jgi:biotin transport system substrate-specific component
MLNGYIKFSPSYDVLIKLIIALLFTCSIGPYTVAIPGEVPITLQTLFLLLFSIAFGWRVGGLNALLYALLGAAGLPVFSGYHGGLEHIDGISGGFFFGFIAATLITGFLVEFPFSKNPFGHIGIWLIGHLIILVMGGFWMRRFRPDNWWDNIEVTLPGAAIKSAVGFLIIQILIRLLAGRNEFYNQKK